MSPKLLLKLRKCGSEAHPKMDSSIDLTPYELNNFVGSTTTESRAKFCTSKMYLCIPLPRWLSMLHAVRRWFCCCWSVVWCASHWLWGFCVCLCFVCICVYSSFAVIFEGKKELIAFLVLRVSCYCKCSVILPHGAVGWSALCDCGIY